MALSGLYCCRAMFASAMVSKSLGVCIAFSIGLTMVYPDATKATFLFYFLVLLSFLLLFAISASNAWAGPLPQSVTDTPTREPLFKTSDHGSYFEYCMPRGNANELGYGYSGGDVAGSVQWLYSDARCLWRRPLHCQSIHFGCQSLKRWSQGRRRHVKQCRRVVRTVT